DSYKPSSNFAFLDVSEVSIDHGGFGFAVDNPDKGPLPFGWLHQPGERHTRGANLSFLDGHVDYHRWEFTPKHFTSGGSPVANPLDDHDLFWLFNRSHAGQYANQLLGLPWP